MVECDWEFPVELHDKFKRFPPCPESIKPKGEWLTPFQTDLTKKVNAKLNSQKLIPHPFKHTDYVLHYRNSKPFDRYIQWSSTHPNRVILLSNNCNLRKITVKLLCFTVKKQLFYC